MNEYQVSYNNSPFIVLSGDSIFPWYLHVGDCLKIENATYTVPVHGVYRFYEYLHDVYGKVLRVERIGS